MSVQVENLEHNMAKLTIEVDAAEFDAACKKVYNRKKGSYNLPGFRKGKVPMNIIEKHMALEFFMKMRPMRSCLKRMRTLWRRLSLMWFPVRK